MPQNQTRTGPLTRAVQERSIPLSFLLFTIVFLAYLARCLFDLDAKISMTLLHFSYPLSRFKRIPSKFNLTKNSKRENLS